MKQFISFVIKETRHILRDKRTMLILFGMPVAMMLIFGFAITTDVKNVRTVIVTSSMDHLTQQAVDRLAASEYFTITATIATPKEAELLIRNQKADMAIVFAQDFGAKMGESIHPMSVSKRKPLVQFIIDGTDPNMAQQWTTYATGVLTNTSGSLVNLEVLLVSPVKPLMVVVAKVVPYMVLAFIILTTILLMGHFVLGVPLHGSIVWIYLVSTIYILLALSLGLLISNIANSQLMALLLSAMVLLVPIIMLSGMMFPVESMPKILQWLSLVVPPRYYIAAMRKLMIMGVGIGEVAHEVTVLTGFTVVLLAISLAKFNKRLE